MRDEFIRFRNYKSRVALRFRIRCVSTFKSVRDFGFWRCLLIVAYMSNCELSNWIKILVVWSSMNVISILHVNYRILISVISIVSELQNTN